MNGRTDIVFPQIASISWTFAKTLISILLLISAQHLCTKFEVTTIILYKAGNFQYFWKQSIRKSVWPKFTVQKLIYNRRTVLRIQRSDEYVGKPEIFWTLFFLYLTQWRLNSLSWPPLLTENLYWYEDLCFKNTSTICESI